MFKFGGKWQRKFFSKIFRRGENDKGGNDRGYYSHCIEEGFWKDSKMDGPGRVTVVLYIYIILGVIHFNIFNVMFIWVYIYIENI